MSPVAAAAGPPPETPVTEAVRNRTHLRRLVATRRVVLEFAVPHGRGIRALFGVRITAREAEELRRDADARGMDLLAERQGETVFVWVQKRRKK